MSSSPEKPAPGWEPFRDLPARYNRVDRQPTDISALLPKLPAAVPGEADQSDCRVCGEKFPARRFRFGGTEITCTVCAACADAPRFPDSPRPDSFTSEVPPGYANTDPSNSGLHPEFLRLATGWRHDASGRGLGFSGRTDLGKTRCLCLALKQAAADGLSIGFCSALDLAKLAADQFEDDRQKRAVAQQRLAYLQTCRVLLLDDIGKEKLTERVASVFFDLVEHRTSRLLSILWTTQFSRAQLVARFGDDRGTAIVRRLCEFAKPKRLE